MFLPMLPVLLLPAFGCGFLRSAAPMPHGCRFPLPSPYVLWQGYRHSRLGHTPARSAPAQGGSRSDALMYFMVGFPLDIQIKQQNRLSATFPPCSCHLHRFCMENCFVAFLRQWTHNNHFLFSDRLIRPAFLLLFSAALW